MFTLKASADFDSAHFLAGYYGKCSNLHGHRWHIEAEIAFAALHDEGQERGMVIDFTTLKKAVTDLASRFDHTTIFEKGSMRENTIEALKQEGFHLVEVPFRPTAENFAAVFYAQLQEQGLPVRKVIVYETPDNCASFEV